MGGGGMGVVVAVGRTGGGGGGERGGAQQHFKPRCCEVFGRRFPRVFACINNISRPR
jgi:hypothetical protein